MLRAETLSHAERVRNAWAMGIHTWRSEGELVSLLNRWPCFDGGDFVIHYDISPLIRCRSDKLLSPPRFIRVNEFTEPSFAQFRAELEAAVHSGQPVIPIVIDSLGGYTYSLLGMCDAIQSARRHSKIATIAEGKAMSCGAVLLTCGDKGLRFVAPSATVLIHDCSDFAAGKTADLQVVAEEAKRLDSDTYRLMDRNCDKPNGYFERLVHEHAHADWYLTPRECKKHGIANHIGIPEMGVTVSVDFAFGLVREERPKRRRRKAKKSEAS